MPYKIDLHTHSILSQDGGIMATEYKSALDLGKLDYIAVTDHNELARALELHRQLGDCIIPGEEIKTTAGEIIGLFIDHKVAPGMSPEKTIDAIRSQGGLVYIPHPFSIYKAGLNRAALEKILKEIDILEVFNARSLSQADNRRAQAFAKEHGLAGASGSDAHSRHGLGSSFTEISAPPNPKNLVLLLRNARLVKQHARIKEFLSPSMNRLYKGLKLIPDK